MNSKVRPFQPILSKLPTPMWTSLILQTICINLLLTQKQNKKKTRRRRGETTRKHFEKQRRKAIQRSTSWQLSLGRASSNGPKHITKGTRAKNRARSNGAKRKTAQLLTLSRFYLWLPFSLVPAILNSSWMTSQITATCAYLFLNFSFGIFWWFFFSTFLQIRIKKYFVSVSLTIFLFF